MKKLLLGLSFVFFSAFAVNAQNGEAKNDTIYVVNDVNSPVEFSKAIGKYLYVKNIVPADLPVKSRSIEIISSISTKLDTKMIQVINSTDLFIPLELFKEKHYTLYIKKNNATIVTKKLIIR